MAGFYNEHPQSGNRVIDSCGFMFTETAKMVTALWLIVGTDIEEDAFIKSLPFLFRMYKIHEPYWTE